MLRFDRSRPNRSHPAAGDPGCRDAPAARRLAPLRAVLLGAAALTLCRCGAEPSNGRPPQPPAATTATAAAAAPAPPRSAASGGREPVAISPGPARTTAAPAPPADPTCGVPSLTIAGDRDRRDADDLERCRHRPTGERRLAGLCGRRRAWRPVDWQRLDEAVPPFDRRTREHVRRIAARGRALGRRSRVVGFAGDSMTADLRFLGPFSRSTPDRYSLAPEVVQRLRTSADGHPGATIIDYYRGQDVEQGRDSFRARRAARDGAPSTWALPPTRHGPAPLERLVQSSSPAVVVVMYGSNDASARFVPLDELAARFEAQMIRIVDYLEQAGVVPVLSTLPRHLTDPGHPPCDIRPGDLSNWRWAVQNSRLSAVVAELACQRHLPIVDYRHALDGLVHFGIGKDGVHPNSFHRGSGQLTAAGLQCGFNLRNYLVLRVLAQLAELTDTATPPQTSGGLAAARSLQIEPDP